MGMLLCAIGFLIWLVVMIILPLYRNHNLRKSYDTYERLERERAKDLFDALNNGTFSDTYNEDNQSEISLKTKSNETQIFGRDKSTGIKTYNGSYVKSKNGRATIVGGEGSNGATAIQTFLMHHAENMSDQEIEILCRWANLSGADWDGRGRVLYSNAFLIYLQQRKRDRQELPPVMDLFISDIMAMELPDLPRPISAELMSIFDGVLNRLSGV